MNDTHAPSRPLQYYAVLSAIVLVAIASVFVSHIAFAATFERDLEVGMSGSDVTMLQTYLADDSTLYPEGLMTGFFGSLTETAVTRFQARYGIDQVGRVGPVTRAKLNALIPSGLGTGGSDDVSAPVMSNETVGKSSTAATIAWATGEPAWSRVMYGTGWPFLYATAPSVADATFDSSSQVTLMNLAPNTMYFYVRESIDMAGNLMWAGASSFRTNN